MKSLSMIASALLTAGVLCLMPGCGDSEPEEAPAPAPAPARRTPDKKVRQLNEMKQMGMLIAMYAIDNDDFLPPDLDGLGVYGGDSLSMIADSAYVGSGLRLSAAPGGGCPMLFDRPRTFADNKIGVLYTDGHVELVPVDGELPATCRETADLLLRGVNDPETLRIIRANADELDRETD